MPNDVEHCGTAKAMGIMNMVESAAQTSAPFVFGLAIMLGTSAGILALGIANAALLPLFLLINKAKTRNSASGAALTR